VWRDRENELNLADIGGETDAATHSAKDRVIGSHSGDLIVGTFGLQRAEGQAME
jgi:hypothetical protein